MSVNLTCEKNHYSSVFVVLVYKNTNVLEEFFNNFKIENAHIVVVNSYWDIESEKRCREIANTNNASYLNIPNKGYSYGNNVGIDYAVNNFDFDFLVISNSDIKILSFVDLNEYKNYSCIIAPEIIATRMNNKHQNPNLPYFSKRLYYNLLKSGYLNGRKGNLLLAHIFSRLSREIFLFKMIWGRNFVQSIFSAHGSFIIISAKAVNRLYPLFLDKMFLYNEELYIALRCRALGIPIYYDSRIKIEHEEGASSDSVGTVKESKESFEILDNYVQQNKLI